MKVDIGNGDDESMEDVVTFDQDQDLSKFCQSLGLKRLPEQPSVKFLLRRDYFTLWQTIWLRYKASIPENQVIITGTAGIGKSAFRFFILRQLEWLRESTIHSEFESVVFDAGQTCFRVKKDGTVCEYTPDFELDLKSIFVLDPCTMVDKQTNLLCGLAVITSSPSSLTQQQSNYNIGNFRAYKLVMEAWTKSEILSVSSKLDLDRFIKFSFLKDGERRCIPRWLSLGEDMIDSEIHDSRNHSSPAALERFLMTGANYIRDVNMPYSLCIIEDVPNVGWAATGFISDYVSKIIHRWICENSALDKKTFISLIRNPFSNGLFGGIFEDFVQTSLGTKRKMLSFTCQSNAMSITFSGTQTYSWSRKKTGHVVMPRVYLEDKIFNKPEGLESPSIDGYGMHDNFLVMIQSTVALSHSGARLLAVKDIISAARGARPTLTAVIVYVVPQNHVAQFRPPMCEELVQDGVVVCVGNIADESELTSMYESNLA